MASIQERQEELLKLLEEFHTHIIGLKGKHRGTILSLIHRFLDRQDVKTLIRKIKIEKKKHIEFADDIMKYQLVQGEKADLDFDEAVIIMLFHYYHLNYDVHLRMDNLLEEFDWFLDKYAKKSGLSDAEKKQLEEELGLLHKSIRGEIRIIEGEYAEAQKSFDFANILNSFMKKEATFWNFLQVWWDVKRIARGKSHMHKFLSHARNAKGSENFKKAMGEFQEAIKDFHDFGKRIDLFMRHAIDYLIEDEVLLKKFEKDSLISDVFADKELELKQKIIHMIVVILHNMRVVDLQIAKDLNDRLKRVKAT